MNAYLRRKIWSAQTGRYSGHSHLFYAMQKYPSTVWSIHSLFEGNSDEEISEHEILLIKSLAARRPEVGYNICAGGEGHRASPSEETRAKLSILAKTNLAFIAARQNYIFSQKGIARPVHVVEALREANLGKKHSRETIEKLQAARLAQPEPHLGKHHSEETKKRISEAKKGKPGPRLGAHLSEATRKAISDTKKQRNAEKRLHLL